MSENIFASSPISNHPTVSEENNEVTVQWIMHNDSSSSLFCFLDNSNRLRIDSTRAKFFGADWYIRIKSDECAGFIIFLRREYFYEYEVDQQICYNFKIKSEKLNTLLYDSGEREFLLYSSYDSTPRCTDYVYPDIPEDLLRIFEEGTSVKIICTVKWLNPPFSRTSLQYKKPDYCQASFRKRQDFPKLTAPKGPERLSNDFKELLETGRNADVTIEVKGQIVLAHQLVLETRCPVFASMFYHNMREKQSKVITITDADPETFKDFLTYLYTGQVEYVTESNAYELYKIGDKYNVIELKNLCKEFILRNLSADSFFVTLSMADMHNDPELMDSVTKYFFKYGWDIIDTNEWQEFQKHHPNLVNKVLKEMFQLDVFEAMQEEWSFDSYFGRSDSQINIS